MRDGRDRAPQRPAPSRFAKAAVFAPTHFALLELAAHDRAGYSGPAASGGAAWTIAPDGGARKVRHGLPQVARAQTVGLLGGSFDPPHAGHVHITRAALRRFGLDRVWWLVSPGNPLKREGPAPLEKRLARARQVMRHPRVEVSDIEARIGTRYTAETLQRLFRLYPGVRFVWLMAADNLTTFHKWEHWQWIMDNVRIGVLARPGDGTAARGSIAAARYAGAMIRGRDSLLLPFRRPPCWCFVNVPMVDESSSDIRARGEWVR